MNPLKKRLYPFSLLIYALIFFYFFAIAFFRQSIFWNILSVVSASLVGSSFFKTWKADPGRVPNYWECMMKSEEEANQEKRYCLVCHIFKPERSHHCSTCGSCILMMDHHCPWMSCCVGLNNRKFFMLTLFWGTLANLLYTKMVIWNCLLGFGADQSFQWSETEVLYGIWGLIVVFVQYCMTKFFMTHWNLVVNNLTTLEDLKKKDSPQECLVISTSFWQS